MALGADLLLGSIQKILDSGLTAFFRWKEGEREMVLTKEKYDMMREELRGQLQLKLLEEWRKPDSEFREFMLEYEGKASDQTDFIKNLRSSVRPVISYWAVLILTLIVTASLFGWVDAEAMQAAFGAIPEKMWWIFIVIFGFWFGGRAVMQNIEMRGEAKKKQKEVEARAEIVKERVKAEAEVAKVTGKDKSKDSDDLKIPGVWGDESW